MTIVCTQCHHEIDPKLANVKTDLIQCPNCHAIHELSELVKTKAIVPLELEPPVGSKINVFNAETSLKLHVPPGKLQGNDYPALGFGLFWVFFLLFGIADVASKFGSEAIWMVPFLSIGLWILFNIWKKLTDRQYIELDSYLLKISKKGVFTTEVTNIRVNDIDKIEMKNPENNTLLLPTITHGIEETTVFDNLTEQEKEWGLNLLKASLMQMAEKKV